MEVIMKKLLCAMIAVIGICGVSNGMGGVKSEIPEEQKLFFACCNALATGNDSVKNETMRKLKELETPCEDLISWVLPYYDYKNKRIDYSQFRLHQSEILVLFSLMSYALQRGLYTDMKKASHCRHWYNKQSRLIKSWL
jgi:hypothetical protein